MAIRSWVLFVDFVIKNRIFIKHKWIIFVTKETFLLLGIYKEKEITENQIANLDSLSILKFNELKENTEFCI